MQSYHEENRLSSDQHLDLLIEEQRSYTRMLAPLGMNLPTQDHLEHLLHTDFETGLYCCGDVEIWPPEKWPDFTDDWHYEPTGMDVLVAEEEFVQAIMEEAAVLEAVLDAEFSNEEDRADFEAWLDSLEPTEGELENRDLSDCGFGHSA